MSRTTKPVGIYWKPRVWDLGRAAYWADLDDPTSPGSFVGWLARALEAHAKLTPKQRAAAAEAAEARLTAPDTRKSFNKKHDLRPSTMQDVEAAIVLDRKQLGRAVSRSMFAQEAVIVAADAARRRRGRALPPPPKTFPTKPPR